jgi:hypothetical protein
MICNMVVLIIITVLGNGVAPSYSVWQSGVGPRSVCQSGVGPR